MLPRTAHAAVLVPSPPPAVRSALGFERPGDVMLVIAGYARGVWHSSVVAVQFAGAARRADGGAPGPDGGMHIRMGGGGDGGPEGPDTEPEEPARGSAKRPLSPADGGMHIRMGGGGGGGGGRPRAPRARDRDGGAGAGVGAQPAATPAAHTDMHSPIGDDDGAAEQPGKRPRGAAAAAAAAAGGGARRGSGLYDGGGGGGVVGLAVRGVLRA